MSKTCVFSNPKPALSITHIGSKQLSRYFYEGTYKITSYRKLSFSVIEKLWQAGLIGAGQDWGIRSKCDGSEEPAGFDLAVAIMVDDRTGEKLDIPAVDFRGEPMPPRDVPYYEYVTFYQCDSG